MEGPPINLDQESKKLELDGPILDLDHIAIAVTDLDATIRWYTAALGFRLVERRETRGERTAMNSAVLQAGAATVVLIQGTTPDSQVSKFIAKFGAGVQHVAFGVRDLKEAMRVALRIGAVADTEIIEGEGIRQIFLRRDAESGVRVELIERRGGNFSDDTVERLFRTFEAKDLY